MVATSIEELEIYIKEAINSTLQNEVKNAALRTIESSATKVVYSSYDPKRYKRRYSLLDDKSYTITSKDMSISINPNASFNTDFYTKNSGNELAYLVEGGNGSHGYNYDFPMHSNTIYPYMNSRPFMMQAEDSLEDIAVEELKTGLLKRGLAIK